MQAPATPRAPQAARAFAQPPRSESPDPIALTGPVVPMATGPTTPPTRANLQGPTGPVGPVENPCSALKPAIPNRLGKAPGGTFGIAGPPGIGTNQSATRDISSEAFDFQVPRITTIEQGPAKRPRKRVFQPTSPTPILQTAKNLLQQALQLAQQAYAKEPNEATESAIRALKSATGGGNSDLSLEQNVDLLLQKANLTVQPNQQGQQALQPQQAQRKPQAQPASYAAMAVKKPTEQPWKVVEPSKKPRPTQQPPKPKEPAEPSKVTIRVTKAPTDFSPLAIRNALNQKLGSTVVARVAISQKENFVITLLPNNTAAEFIKQKPRWQSVFEAYDIQGVEEPSTWLKLIAHGVPTRDFSLDLFTGEVETFNPNIRVKGSPRWLNEPSYEKRAGSVVFAVATEGEKRACIQKGLTIAGITVKVEAIKAFTATTQCYWCQGYNYNPRNCKNRPKCRLCAKIYPTKYHKCPTCSASGACSHLQPLCSNCNGPHPANHPDCEVHRAIKARRPNVGRTTGSITGPTTGPIAGPSGGSITGPIRGFYNDKDRDFNIEADL